MFTGDPGFVTRHDRDAFVYAESVTATSLIGPEVAVVA
jgi:hypothetical protein